MAESLGVRRDRFGQLVARAIRDALSRGLSIAEVERQTGVPKSTFYRWRDGDWRRSPNPGQVRAFCTGLGIQIHVAYRILGWEDANQGAAEEPTFVNPTLREIARRLADPNVPEEEKRFINESLLMLAARQAAKTTKR